MNKSLTFGDQTLTFRELTAADLKDFGAWLEERGTTPASGYWRFDELMTHVEEVDGMLWLGWRSASSHHPELTMTKFSELVPLGRIADLASVLIDLPGSEDAEPGK